MSRAVADGVKGWLPSEDFDPEGSPVHGERDGTADFGRTRIDTAHVTRQSPVQTANLDADAACAGQCEDVLDRASDIQNCGNAGSRHHPLGNVPREFRGQVRVQVDETQDQREPREVDHLP